MLFIVDVLKGFLGGDKIFTFEPSFNEANSFRIKTKKVSQSPFINLPVILRRSRRRTAGEELQLGMISINIDI